MSETQAELQSAIQDGEGIGIDERYLDLLKQCLTRYLFIDEEVHGLFGWGWKRTLYTPVERFLAGRGLQVWRVGGNAQAREVGRDRPTHAETMIGLRRLDNIQMCVTDVVRSGVPGDLIETGVWRGGATILMRATLAALGDTSRRVWVADSFQGLPRPNPSRYPADAQFDRRLRMLSKTGLSILNSDLVTRMSEAIWNRLHDTVLAVTVDDVRSNFARYGLLDDQVEFLVGWFADTLATAPIEKLAVMRLDGDFYESTMDALSALYPKLSVGGYVIIDDYGCIDACRAAVHDYREAHGITDEIKLIDWTGAYWKRT